TAATAKQATSEVARDLSTRIDEAEKRACDTARGELEERLAELRRKSRETVLVLHDRLKVLKAKTAELGDRLDAEQQDRRAGETALKEDSEKKAALLRQELANTCAGLAHEVAQEVAARREADAELKQELLQALQEANARLQEEISELRNLNVSLRGRVE